MGAELSTPSSQDGTAVPPPPSSSTIGSQFRRVGSHGSFLEQQQRGLRKQNSGMTTSASTTALSSMVPPSQPLFDNSPNGSANSDRHYSGNGSTPPPPAQPPKSATSKLLDNPLFNSMRRGSGSRTTANQMDGVPPPPPSLSNEDNSVESLDLPIVEWEGYVTKRGHLVRNWKCRFFTLESNHLSYYENKVDARNREHLKGRVYVATVKLEKVSKSGHGFDFTFETTEGKVFHCSVPTEMEQLAWVYFLEAGIDCNAMKKNSQPIYNTYRHGRLPDMRTDVAYDVYRQLIGGDVTLTTELMSYFNKDLVFSTTYPKTTPLHGDFFGREGLLHFLGAFFYNMEIVELTVLEVSLTASDGKSLLIKGSETLKSKINGQVVTQPWTHRVQFGPYGRILKLKMEMDTKNMAPGWKTFGVKTPFSEMSDAAVRSTRCLSISLKDFTVYNVIGKGGFGTVVNAVKKSDGQIYALKILEKSKMTKYDIESSFTEMRVAQNIHHPFIAGLRIAFQSRTKLFLGMNYYGGGDLFHHMSKGASCRIPPARAHFYTAELVLGIHHLHQHDILYRDIKPENVMIDSDGHIALVDFGLAKLHVSNYNGAKTMAGSPQYTAPELLLPKNKRSYGKAADWWSLGILLYEMSVGKSPFYDSNVEKMYHKIQHEALTFPEKPALSDDLKDILHGFLQKDATKRLGSNISDILTHPYFANIDWDLLLQKKIDAPWKPSLSNPLDVEYVDAEFTEMDARQEVQSPTDKSSKKGFLALVSSRGNRKSTPPVQDPTFKDFTYFCEDPDALVEVTNLVHELHPTPATPPSPPSPPPPPPPPSLPPVMTECYLDTASLEVPMPDPCGTPLSSFVENGKLNAAALARSPEHVRKELAQVEIAMVQQFERVEVTISRERPTGMPPAPLPSPPTRREATSSASSSSSSTMHDASLTI